MKRSLLAQIKQQVAANYETVKKTCDAKRASKLKYYNLNESPSSVGKLEAKRIREKRGQHSEDPRTYGSYLM